MLEDAASFSMVLAAVPELVRLRALRLRLLLEELLEELLLLLERLLEWLLERLFERLFEPPLADFFACFALLPFFDFLLLFELFDERPAEELLEDALLLFEEPASEPL